jgi:hypothetical protein
LWKQQGRIATTKGQPAAVCGRLSFSFASWHFELMGCDFVISNVEDAAKRGGPFLRSKSGEIATVCIEIWVVVQFERYGLAGRGFNPDILRTVKTSGFSP